MGGTFESFRWLLQFVGILGVCSFFWGVRAEAGDGGNEGTSPDQGCEISYVQGGGMFPRRTRIEITAQGGEAQFFLRGQTRSGKWKAKGTRECHRFLVWAEHLGLKRPEGPETSLMKAEKVDPSPSPESSVMPSASPAPEASPLRPSVVPVPGPDQPSETLRIQWSPGVSRTWELAQKQDVDAQKFVGFLIRFSQKRVRTEPPRP